MYSHYLFLFDFIQMTDLINVMDGACKIIAHFLTNHGLKLDTATLISILPYIKIDINKMNNVKSEYFNGKLRGFFFLIDRLLSNEFYRWNRDGISSLERIFPFKFMLVSLYTENRVVG